MPTKGQQPEHGTIGRYVNHQCRCEPCRSAASAYKKEQRQRKHLALGGLEQQPYPIKERADCGTIAGVNRHKRITKTPVCEACQSAQREYQREWRKGQKRRPTPGLKN